MKFLLLFKHFYLKKYNVQRLAIFLSNFDATCFFLISETDDVY
jgi:hypothetical protein